MNGHSFRAILLVASPFCLAMGLVLPLVRFDRLYVFSDTPSLLSIISSLWQSGDVLLAMVVALVSVVLPSMKLFALAIEATSSGEGRRSGGLVARVLPHLSRWSMMDVLLVAIVITAAKSSGLASAFTQAGIWFYAGSAIISGLLHFLLRKEQGPKE